MLESQILLDAMALLASPQLWAWIAIAAAVGYLLWLLSPILAPFLFAGILAYMFDPLVERLTRRRVPRTLAVVLVLDRKSTRLNSSHGYISYAVFCLKKKKKGSSHLVT